MNFFQPYETKFSPNVTPLDFSSIVSAYIKMEF